MKTEERQIEIVEQIDIARTVFEARTMAEAAGFGKPEQFMIATAASELATNILRYAGTGQVAIKAIERGIEIVAQDSGPGIQDVAKIMEDNFTTTRGSLGVGLPGVRRLMDELEIQSVPGNGTTIMARKRR